MWPCFPYFGLTSFFQILFLALVKRREEDFMLIKIITTTSSRDEAEKIGSVLVEEGLAACCQVSGPILSIYPWKGIIERNEEWMLVIKTIKDMYGACEKRIEEMHSYECPQIVAFNAEAVYRPYMDWIRGWIEEKRS